MISAAEGGGRGSSSFRFRTRSRFRRTALRVPPDILCDKINNQNRLYDEIKDKRTWLRGKDGNAKAKIHRNMEKIGQHNGYTGMENETTLKRWDRTSSRNSKHEDSKQLQLSYGYNEAINEMF